MAEDYQMKLTEKAEKAKAKEAESAKNKAKAKTKAEAECPRVEQKCSTFFWKSI